MIHSNIPAYYKIGADSILGDDELEFENQSYFVLLRTLALVLRGLFTILLIWIYTMIRKAPLVLHR